MVAHRAISWPQGAAGCWLKTNLGENFSYRGHPLVVGNNTNISEPLEQSLGGDGVESFPKVQKATIDIQRAMTCLLNNGLKCKDVANGLVLKLESNLPFGFE